MGLFKCFNETLDAADVFANEGKIVDAPDISTIFQLLFALGFYPKVKLSLL